MCAGVLLAESSHATYICANDVGSKEAAGHASGEKRRARRCFFADLRHDEREVAALLQRMTYRAALGEAVSGTDDALA